MHVVRRYVPLAAALAALLSAACIFSEPDDTPAPRVIVPNTPAHCLKVIAASWNGRNYDRFQPCLSPDFVFYFNPIDVGQTVEGYVIPVSWNYTQMTAAVKNMFEQAYDIEMAIPTSTVGTPGSEDTTWQANTITVKMTLLTEPGTGYRIGDGYCDFAFEKYDDDGKDRWRLTEWRDYSREGYDDAPTTLGKVLTLFR
jgi:hypothetical protein